MAHKNRTLGIIIVAAESAHCKMVDKEKTVRNNLRKRCYQYLLLHIPLVVLAVAMAVLITQSNAPQWVIALFVLASTTLAAFSAYTLVSKLLFTRRLLYDSESVIERSASCLDELRKLEHHIESKHAQNV